MARFKDTASSQDSAVRKETTQPSAISTQPKRKSNEQNRKKRTEKTKAKKTKASGPRTSTQPRKKKPLRVTIPVYRPVEFPEVKGKTVEELRLYLHDDDNGIAIDFTDKTYLNFDLEPRLTVRTRLADVSTGDLRDLKTWPAMMSESSYLDDD